MPIEEVDCFACINCLEERDEAVCVEEWHTLESRQILRGAEGREQAGVCVVDRFWEASAAGGVHHDQLPRILLAGIDALAFEWREGRGRVILGARQDWNEFQGQLVYCLFRGLEMLRPVKKDGGRAVLEKIYDCNYWEPRGEDEGCISQSSQRENRHCKIQI